MAFCPTCRSDFPGDWKRCPTDEIELLPSRNVGKYRIDGLIGAGGMGAVYKAFNPDTRATVAMKLMHPAASTVENARARFQREAAAIAALRTRHLVSVYDFGATADDTLYLVMEYLVGHNLRPEIDCASPSMAVQRINLVMDGALRGLGAAHRAGIVHRDLKPENIFLADTEDGEVAKVLDFGIAQVQTATNHSALTQEGALMGTPAYMAPEQVSGKRGEIGTYSDVYAMGVIAYEMFTGDTPFTAESLTEMLGRVLEREFRPIAEAKPDLPHAITALIDKAMHEDPSERHRDANELRAAWLAAYRSFAPSIRDATVPEFPGDASVSMSRMGTAPTAMPDTGTALPGAGTAPRRADTPLPDADTRLPSTVPRMAAPARVTSQPGANTGANTGAAAVARRGRRWLPIAAFLAVAGAGVGGYLMFGDGSKGSARRPVLGPRADAAVAAIPERLADAAPSEKQAASTPTDMARLPGGAFDVGVNPDAYRGFKDLEPRHTVSVSAFLIDKTEMTAKQHRSALAKSGRAVSGSGSGSGSDAGTRMPARNVSWNDASAACKALGKRLPTEHEWAFAASRSALNANRARMRTKGVRGPAAVGTHPGDCTSDGVCDLLGNVSEWTADPWRDQHGSISKALRAVRGASFRVAPAAKWYATIHARVKLERSKRDAEVGYRCAQDINQ